ncbi:MAG TPA: ATP-binding cassette domain-containing protein [Burkholderiaceae bacterium]|nr:ATP-binding cassette domain-containing protein [Burkholderiaceae bacterium]
MSPAAPLPLLEVEGLSQAYRLPRHGLLGQAPRLAALDGVSFTLWPGRHLGVVGESGAGKSTLARLVMALERPSAGRVRLLGQDLHALPAAALRAARAQFQMVFQDPYGSLDPRHTLARIVGEPLELLAHVTRREREQRSAQMLEAVGLRTSDLHKVPHEFSGGQRQRIAIARALVTHPRLIVADEALSALDVSVQAQVLNLLQDLAGRFGVTYLFISHDLAVVQHLCADALVLQAGRVVEQGPAATLFRTPAHPYTQALVRAVPPDMPRPAGAAAPLAHNARGCEPAPVEPHGSQPAAGPSPGTLQGATDEDATP